MSAQTAGVPDVPSLVAIVVLYGMAPDAAPTLEALAACDGLDACRHVVVVDHGAQPQDAAFVRLAARFAPGQALYRHDPRNPPLGSAYNAAIRAHLGNASYVLILDQDTRLPRDFICAGLDAAAANGHPALMAPHMVAGDRIASPCRLVLGWGRRWAAPRPGWQSLRANTLINSGAWVHRRVFRDLGIWYSESLPLYGTDTDFFRRLGRREPRMIVLALCIAHDLSFDSSTVDVKARKVDAMLAANRAVYAADGPLVRAGVRCMNAVVRLKYAVQYRTLRFL